MWHSRTSRDGYAKGLGRKRGIVRILTVDTANGCGSVASMSKWPESYWREYVAAWGESNQASIRAYGVGMSNWAASLPRVEPCELEYPECGYELDVSSAGVFTMRTSERVCLGVYLEGRLVEVQGPVQS